jgi:hypothetical protein
LHGIPTDQAPWACRRGVGEESIGGRISWWPGSLRTAATPQGDGLGSDLVEEGARKNEANTSPRPLRERQLHRGGGFFGLKAALVTPARNFRPEADYF